MAMIGRRTACQSALRSVAQGKSFTEAVCAAGLKSGDGVSKLVKRHKPCFREGVRLSPACEMF